MIKHHNGHFIENLKYQSKKSSLNFIRKTIIDQLLFLHFDDCFLNFGANVLNVHYRKHYTTSFSHKNPD